jgi:hypothetical protein
MSQQMQEINCKECYLEMMFDSDRFCFTCENCQGTHVLLTPQCRIVKIGIELEGGWYEMPSNEHNRLDPLHSYTWHHDSSVESLDMGSCGDCDYCNDGDSEDCTEGSGHAGEIVSFPMYIDDVHPDTSETELLWHLWTKKFYPEEHNYDCGGHFHISFDNIQAFEFLCTVEFFDHFQTELYRWGVRANIKNSNFWDRLKGENSMCRTTFRGVEQLYTVNDNYPDCRYSILNFQYNKHGTLEFRILPMFNDPKIYIKAVQVCMDITQKYLDKMANKPISIECDDDTEIDFEGRINSTTVQEYMNTEPADIVPLEDITFGIPDDDTNDSLEAVASYTTESIQFGTPLETNLQIISNEREIDENGDSLGYVLRFTYGHDNDVFADIIHNRITEGVSSNTIRVNRFMDHFNTFGLVMARTMFDYPLRNTTGEILQDISV